MFSAVRRFGVSQVLRASATRSVAIQWTPQLLKGQTQSIRSPALHRSFQTFPALKSAAAEAISQAGESFEEEPELITQFIDLKNKGLIDPRIVRNITSEDRMGLKTMTPVQSQTIHQMLRGDDVLAQAKTGTGKTLAFLVPTMQNILSDPSIEGASARQLRDGADSSDIRALIISPTRELAEQIATEAIKLSTGTGLKVQTAVGGTQKTLGLRRIQRDGCHLLIGTPGRIKDIFSDRASGVSAPHLNTLILDEADRLLDIGFSQDIREIQDLLPDPSKVDRQTLLFSATVPKSVMQMVRRTAKPNFKFVKTVRDDEVPTHLKVPQRTVFLRGYENAFPAVLELAKSYQAKQQADASLRPFKAIVYFNTTNEVTAAAEAFKELRSDPQDNRSRSPLGRMRILYIQSRLTQASRTYNADTFRRASEAILFSSDVTARGMDFPDVTHVIQVGIPRDRETYIHRLGRTARANKTGEGWLFLVDGENDTYADRLRDLPLQEDHSSLATALVDISQASADASYASPATAQTIEQIRAAMQDVPVETREVAYKSQLGVLSNNFRSKREGVKVLNNLALHGYCLSEVPTVTPRLASLMGLDRVRELAVADEPRHSSAPRRGSDMEFSPRRRDDRGMGRQSYDRDRRDRRDRHDRHDRHDRRGRSDRFDRYDDGFGSRSRYLR